jgi:long-chain acyl-CoA synthetase
MNHVRSTPAARQDKRAAGSGRTLPEALWAQASARGSAPALLHKRLGIWRRWSWAEAAEEVRRLAGGLAARGVGAGDRVLIAGRHRPRLGLALLACQWLGAIPVLLAEEDQAAFGQALKEQRPRAAILGTEHEVLLLRAALPAGVAPPLLIGDDTAVARDAAVLSREALLAEAAGPAPDPAAGTPDATAVIVYEPAESGPSRGVALTHAALLDRAADGVRALGLGARDLAFGGLPLGWGPALLLGHVQSLLAGFPLAYPESDATALADLREAGPTLLFGPPRMFRHLRQAAFLRAAGARGRWRRALDAALGFGDARRGWVPGRLIAAAVRDQLGLGQVRRAIVFGGAVAPQVARFFAALGVPLRAAYTPAPAGYLAALGDAAAPVGLRPLAGIALSVDADGEILVRDRGAETWRGTGDRGALAADGSLAWSGRLADGARPSVADARLLIDLEAELRGSLFIEDACVLATPTRRLAALISADLEALAAWAQTHGVAARTPAALLREDRIRGLLAREIAAVDANGRIAQFAIAADGFTARDGDVTAQGALRRAALLARHEAAVAALRAGSGLAIPPAEFMSLAAPAPQVARAPAFATAAT